MMTPYAHPILLLLYATDLAKVGAPDATLPGRFSFPQDGIAQVQMLQPKKSAARTRAGAIASADS